MIACTAMVTTADKIKTLRRDNAMTQDDLVAKSGVSLATIQRAERGERISADSLASIAAAFDIAASELVSSEGRSFEPYLPLDPVTSGRQLVVMLRLGRHIDFGFSELDNLDDARAVEAFHDFCTAFAQDESVFSPVAQVTCELKAKEHLAALDRRGFRVGGATFDITAYEVDDDGGTGLGIIFAKWDETRTALRVGTTGEEIARAHVMDKLDKYEVLKGDAVIFPRPVNDDGGGRDDLLAPWLGEGEA